MKLKIKKDADLKELEKHLIKLNILDNEEIYIENVYCCVSEEDKEFIKDNNIDNCFVQFFINNKNEIDYCCYPEMRNEDIIDEKIFDLTKLDLLEKV